MNLDEFRVMVEANLPWFSGVHPEPVSAFDAAEHAIGVQLPPSMRWLLESKGYSAACGIDSLEEAIASTLRCRSALGLPAYVIVLNDWGDSGVVVLVVDSGANPELWPVYWMGAHNLYQMAGGKALDQDIEKYEGFSEWVRVRLNMAIKGDA